MKFLRRCHYPLFLHFLWWGHVATEQRKLEATLLYKSEIKYKIQDNHEINCLRSIRLEVFCKTVSQNSQENASATTLLKQRLQLRYLHVNFAKFLRAPFLSASVVSTDVFAT